jgi:dUTP pyrophosphatase
MITVNIKKLHPNAVIPSYAKEGDAGMDLTAVDMITDPAEGIVEYPTGLSFEIPVGYVGLLFPRSSVSNKSVMLANSVGVVDSGYRGPVSLKFRMLATRQVAYEVGDRIGQIVIMPYPKVNFNVVEELSETERGEGGFGSSGN